MAITRLHLTATAAFITLAPAFAEAHPGTGGMADFTHGFVHPVLGLDHIIAMVAVGLYAAVLGGRALWIMPSAFLIMMATGGILAMNSVSLPLVEVMIAASVLSLAATVVLRPRLPVSPAAAIIGFFAIFHGQAHGTEIPPDASGFEYASGFLLATALLHATGIWLGSKMAYRKMAVP